jgi:hypothetical protein
MVNKGRVPNPKREQCGKTKNEMIYEFGTGYYLDSKESGQTDRN